MRAEISFMYQNCWACIVSQKFGARVRFLDRHENGGTIQEDVEIYNKSKEDLDEAVRYVSSYSHIQDCKVLERSRDGTIAKLTISTKQGSCPLYLAIQTFCVDDKLTSVERVDYRGTIHWNLDTNGDNKIERLREVLEKKFGIWNINVKRGYGKMSMSKSMFLLKEAFERGYFDVPKKVSIEELSEALNVPVSTLNINVRRALKNVLREETC